MSYDTEKRWLTADADLLTVVSLFPTTMRANTALEWEVQYHRLRHPNPLDRASFRTNIITCMSHMIPREYNACMDLKDGVLTRLLCNCSMPYILTLLFYTDSALAQELG